MIVPATSTDVDLSSATEPVQRGRGTLWAGGPVVVQAPSNDVTEPVAAGNNRAPGRAFAMNELSWLEINLTRLAANLAWWRELVRPAGAKVCAVVKANAYGLGAAAVARHLERQGVDMLAVYAPPQAEELLDAGVGTPILLLNPMRALAPTVAVRAALQRRQVHLAINDVGQLRMAQEMARAAESRIPVHLHVDTGMSRSGLSPQAVGEILSEIAAHRELELAGVMSHLATAHTDGARDAQQQRQFAKVLAEHPALRERGVIKHLSATAGACRGREYHYDMVRIGLGLWGYGPDLMQNTPALPLANTLAPVVRWRARVVHMQHYPAGATVGYGCTYTLKRPSVLGVVPVGYADGYALALSNQASVLVPVQGTLLAAPVLGRVSMDQMVLDLTDAVARDPQVGLGTVVDLLSNERAAECALPRLATLAQSSEYEVLCRMSPRLPRRYVEA